MRRTVRQREGKREEQREAERYRETWREIDMYKDRKTKSEEDRKRDGSLCGGCLSCARRLHLRKQPRGCRGGGRGRGIVSFRLIQVIPVVWPCNMILKILPSVAVLGPPRDERRRPTLLFSLCSLLSASLLSLAKRDSVKWVFLFGRQLVVLFLQMFLLFLCFLSTVYISENYQPVLVPTSVFLNPVPRQSSNRNIADLEVHCKAGTLLSLGGIPGFE